MLYVIEAIHSCALAHRSDCACRVCRAASGDAEALDGVITDVLIAVTPELRPPPARDER